MSYTALALQLFAIGWLIYLIATLGGCATPGVPAFNDTLRRNQEIQDCILRGGHPHLGPDNTIICQ